MNPKPQNRERQRAAYLITFGCYGSWLHGREGSVDREHNTVGSPTLAEDSTRLCWERSVMTQEPYTLNEARRATTLKGLQEACARRGWTYWRLKVRPSHVHVVVEADRSPELVMSALKACASRTLNKSEHNRKRWGPSREHSVSTERDRNPRDR